MKKVVIFDAYGTLFDVNAAARNYSKETADINFINTWEKVSKLWRDKQIAYTWYYTSIGYKTNFWKVTEDSLDYALEFYNLKDNKNYNEIEKFREINSDLVKDILNLEVENLKSYTMIMEIL